MMTEASSYVLMMVQKMDGDGLFDWHYLDGSYSAVCCQMKRGDDDPRFLGIRCDEASFCVNWCGKHMLFLDDRMHKWLSSAPTYIGPSYSTEVLDDFSQWFDNYGDDLPPSAVAIIGDDEKP